MAGSGSCCCVGGGGRLGRCRATHSRNSGHSSCARYRATSSDGHRRPIHTSGAGTIVRLRGRPAHVHAGWLAARDLANSAIDIWDTLPKGIKFDDPRIQANPEWRSTLQHSGELFRQAGDALEPQIAPGTTPLLAASARAAVAALRTEGYSFETSNPGMGNASAMEDETSGLMAALCTRLVPE